MEGGRGMFQWSILRKGVSPSISTFHDTFSSVLYGRSQWYGNNVSLAEILKLTTSPLVTSYKISLPLSNLPTRTILNINHSSTLYRLLFLFVPILASPYISNTSNTVACLQKTPPLSQNCRGSLDHLHHQASPTSANQVTSHGNFPNSFKSPALSTGGSTSCWVNMKRIPRRPNCRIAQVREAGHQETIHRG